jgi:uncharacterized protein YkwD
LKNRIVALAAGAVSVVLVAVAAAPTDASARLLPSRQVCEAQKNPGAGEREQERALRCVIDHVRSRAGARRLSTNRALQRAAGSKAKDLARCGFTHTACGRPADAWAEHYGYDSSSWSWGENLAEGTRRMTARAAVKSWLNSPPHRATLTQGSFEHIGAALERSGAHAYWVLELGCHGC